MKEGNEMKTIVVDIDVWNCQIRAFKPEIQTFIPNDEAGKNAVLEFCRCGQVEQKTDGISQSRIVNRYGAINIRSLRQHRDRSG
jgi:hypothetical protein